MILAIADLHLNDNPRDKYRHDFVGKTLPKLVEEYRVKTLIINGDFTDQKDRHRSWLVNKIVGYLHALTEQCDVICNKGNHDYVEADDPFFAFLGKIKGITWINKPTRWEHCLFLPHTNNYKWDWDISLKGHKFIFAHQTFQGAKVGPRTLDGIPLDIFPTNAQIVSGDVHVPQTFDIVTYIGSPYLCDFGDNYKPRVLLIDTERQRVGATAIYSIYSILCPGPQKRLIEIKSIADLDKQSAINPGDILKVRISVTAKDHAKWPELQAAVKAWGKENDYQIYLVQPQVELAGNGSAAKRKTGQRSDEQYVELYGQSRGVGNDTLRIGQRLARKA